MGGIEIWDNLGGWRGFIRDGWVGWWFCGGGRQTCSVRLDKGMGWPQEEHVTVGRMTDARSSCIPIGGRGANSDIIMRLGGILQLGRW